MNITPQGDPTQEKRHRITSVQGTGSEPDIILTSRLPKQVTKPSVVNVNTGGAESPDIKAEGTNLEMTEMNSDKVMRIKASRDSDARINISKDNVTELTTVFNEAVSPASTEGTRVTQISTFDSPNVSPSFNRARSIDKLDHEIQYNHAHTMVGPMFDEQEGDADNVQENRKITYLKERQNLDIVRLLLFIVCLCVFVVLGVVQRGAHTSDAYFQTSVPSRVLLHTPFADVTGGDITFENINSIANIYSFMKEVLIPFVYRDKQFLYGQDFSFDSFHTTLYNTSGPQMYVLGGVRLRQIRYSYVDCDTNVREHDFYHCIDRKASFDNITVMVEGILENITYGTREENDEQIYFIGKTKPFGGEGHIWDLPPPAMTVDDIIPTYNRAQTQVKDLFEHGFVTELTRGLFVDFNLFNPNTGLHTLSRVLFEIHPAGSIIPYHSFNTWNFLLYWKGNTNTTVVLVFFIFLIALLVFDHVNSLYIFCIDSNYPKWMASCLGPLQDDQNAYRPHPEESLDRANRAKYIYITGVSRQAIENECDEIQDWIYEHLEELFSRNEGENGLEAFEVLEITFMNEWRCCGVEIAGIFTKHVSCTDYCHNGLRVRVSATIYDNPAYKQGLQLKIREKGGGDWSKATIRGADQGDGECCRAVCGAGGQAFYRYSFWNKLDLFVIISLMIQCVLHIYFIFKLSSETEDKLLRQSQFVSLRVLHSNLVAENNMFVVNGFLIPLKILQYCTMLTDDFKWFHEFMLIAQHKICTFFALLFVFLITFSVSGWLAFSADLYDFRHLFASILACMRYIFVGPDIRQLELSSHISGYIYYIFWYIMMSLILIPLLIAVFVNLALKVEEWVKSGSQSKKNLDVRSEDHLRIIFTRPRPLKKAKEWFSEAFREQDVDKIVDQVIADKNIKFQVDLDCALEILNKIRQESVSFPSRRENTSDSEQRHQEVLEAVHKLQAMVQNLSFSRGRKIKDH